MKKKHPEMVKITVKPQKKTVIGFSGDKWISFLIYVGTISLDMLQTILIPLAREVFIFYYI